MRPLVVRVALLVAVCASQNGIQASDFGVSLSAECRRSGDDGKFSMIRETFLNRFNQLRQKIAKGETVDKLDHNGPGLMYGSRYSCGLEDIASKLLKLGKTQHHNSLVFNYTSSRPGPLTGQVHDAIEKLKTNAPATLLTPFVPFFGCAVEEKQMRMTLLCIFYSEPSVASNDNSPCTKNSDCPLYEEKSTCSHSLCWAPTGYEIAQ